MRGSRVAAIAGLALNLVCAGVTAADPAKGDPGFRLLVLDGRMVRWTLPARGLPVSVSYAFLREPAEFPGARNCAKMLPPAAALAPSRIDREAFRREVRAAFDMWQQAVNIDFHETDDVSRAGILIGAEAEPRGQAFTNVTPHRAKPPATMDAIAQSLICLNPEKRWKIGFDGNLDVYDIRYTIAHEVGHAIGLDHPGAEGSLMSYRYVERDRRLQPGDIAGAIVLYGARGSPTAPVGAPLQTFASHSGNGTQAVGSFGLGEQSTDTSPTRR